MSAAEYAWSETRDRAIHAFGTAPSAALESELLEHFQETPARVVAELEDVAAKFKAGSVRSPWGIVRSRLAAPAGGPDVVVVDVSERERAIARAETWLRAAGVHVDREPEVLASLFEDPGERTGPVLGRWAEDEELKAQMLELWRELRRKVSA